MNPIDTTKWLERTETILETLTEHQIHALLIKAAQDGDHGTAELCHNARRGRPNARIGVAELLARAELIAE